MEVQKFCFTCNTLKDMSEFNAQRSKKDGLQSKCKSCLKEYRKLNNDRLKAYNIQYRERNKEFLLDKSREYKAKNKESLVIKNKEYNSRESTKLRKSLTHKKRMRYDVNYRLNFNIRRYMRLSISNHIKKQKNRTSILNNIKLLEYTPYELKEHLESLFKPGMNWENYGVYGWHIDHIKPLCLFDLTKDDQIKLAWSLSNLQPLWAKENLTKNKKF